MCARARLLHYTYCAIRPYHPSLFHSMLLAFVFLTGNQSYLPQEPLIRRDKGDTLSLRFLFLDILGRHILNQHCLAYGLAYGLFLLPPKSPPFFTSRYNTLLVFLALLRPSSALLDPIPRFSSLGSGPPHNGAISLGRRVGVAPSLSLSHTLLVFLALLRPSSALLDPIPRFPSLGSGPPHNGAISLGRRVGVAPSLSLSLSLSLSRLPDLSPIPYPLSHL